MAHRRDLGAPERGAARTPAGEVGQESAPQRGDSGLPEKAKTTGLGGNERGFEPAKKVEGRKRHLLVDTEGLVLKAKVHSAKVPDQDGLRLLLEPVQRRSLRSFRTCGSRRATRGGAGGGLRRSSA
jgi:hypothetical protein